MFNRLLEKVRWMFKNRRGEFYVDKVIALIIAVVVGGLLLSGLYALFNNTVLPGLSSKIQGILG